MMEMSRGWQSVATEMQDIQAAVRQAVRGIGAAQQGAAADAATHSTSALMPWLDDGVTAANGVAARVSEQAASFAHTRDSMPPPRVVPDVSFSQDPATWTADHAIEWLPGIQTQNEAAHLAAQQDQERARELMHGYQGTSNDNLAVRDHFAAAPTVVAEGGGADPGRGRGRRRIRRWKRAAGTGRGASGGGPFCRYTLDAGRASRRAGRDRATRRQRGGGHHPAARRRLPQPSGSADGGTGRRPAGRGGAIRAVLDPGCVQRGESGTGRNAPFRRWWVPTGQLRATPHRVQHRQLASD
jgi:hypothetical protein